MCVLMRQICACRLKTYGCSHNVSDSEYMQGVLASYGYRFTQDANEAQLWCATVVPLPHMLAKETNTHVLALS